MLTTSKKMYGILALTAVLLSAGISGCGAPEEAQEDAVAPSASAKQLSGHPEAKADQDPSALQSVNPEKDITVHPDVACCFFMCSDNTHLWWGPNRDVAYNNCTNTGAAWCGNHHHGHVYAAKWDDC